MENLRNAILSEKPLSSEQELLLVENFDLRKQLGEDLFGITKEGFVPFGDQILDAKIILDAWRKDTPVLVGSGIGVGKTMVALMAVKLLWVLQGKPQKFTVLIITANYSGYDTWKEALGYFNEQDILAYTSEGSRPKRAKKLYDHMTANKVTFTLASTMAVRANQRPWKKKSSVADRKSVV